MKPPPPFSFSYHNGTTCSVILASLQKRPTESRAAQEPFFAVLKPFRAQRRATATATSRTAEEGSDTHPSKRTGGCLMRAWRASAPGRSRPQSATVAGTESGSGRDKERSDGTGRGAGWDTSAAHQICTKFRKLHWGGLRHPPMSDL